MGNTRRKEPKMNGETRQLLEQHDAAWSRGDIDGILACFTDNCVFEDNYWSLATYLGQMGLMPKAT